MKLPKVMEGLKRLQTKISSARAEVYCTLLVLILLSSCLLPIYIYTSIDMDEIWNYQFARRILYGQIPYRDFFMLMTPLSAQVNACFLEWFSDNLIIIRWVGGIISLVTGIILYRILRLLGQDIVRALGFVLVFILIVYIYPKNNYSWYSVLFLSAALFFEIKRYQSHGRNYLLWAFGVGISIGLLTLTKQNPGVIALLGSLVVLSICSFSIQVSYQDNPILTTEPTKYFLSNSIFEIMGFVLVVLPEITFLSAYVDWMDLGKQMTWATIEFAQHCSLPFGTLFKDQNIIISLIAIIAPACLTMTAYFGITGGGFSLPRSIFLTLLMYGVVDFTMIFPISDLTHLSFATILPVFGLAATHDPQYFNRRNYLLIRYGSIIVILGLIICWFDVTVAKGVKQIDHQVEPAAKHYESVPISCQAGQELQQVGQFIVDEEINGKEVWFLNYRADYYLIPIDKFSYRYDTLFWGNLGAVGANEIIERVSGPREIVILIRGKDMAINRQENPVFESFVRSHFIFSRNVCGFDVYTNR